MRSAPVAADSGRLPEVVIFAKLCAIVFLFGDRVGIWPDILLFQCLPTASLDWHAWQTKGYISTDTPRLEKRGFCLGGRLSRFGYSG